MFFFCFFVCLNQPVNWVFFARKCGSQPWIEKNITQVLVLFILLSMGDDLLFICFFYALPSRRNGAFVNKHKAKGRRCRGFPLWYNIIVLIQRWGATSIWDRSCSTRPEGGGRETPITDNWPVGAAAAIREGMFCACGGQRVEQLLGISVFGNNRRSRKTRAHRGRRNTRLRRNLISVETWSALCELAFVYWLVSCFGTCLFLLAAQLPVRYRCFSFFFSLMAAAPTGRYFF